MGNGYRRVDIDRDIVFCSADINGGLRNGTIARNSSLGSFLSRHNVDWVAVLL